MGKRILIYILTYPPDEVIEIPEFHNVTLSIKEGTLTKTSMTVIVNGSNTYPGKLCGLSEYDYKIFKNKNNKWIELPPDKIFASHCLLGIKPNSTGFTDLDIEWKDTYGTLKSGKYKLVIPVSYMEGIGDNIKFEQGEVAIDFEI